VISTTTWDWHDNNGNKLYEHGEVNLDPNGPDFRSTWRRHDPGCVHPNEKQPKTDEFSLTFERELVANTAVRVTGCMRETSIQYRLSEISRDGRVHDSDHESRSGPDGRLGTGDDTGQCGHLLRVPHEPGRRPVLGNDVRQRRPRFELQDLRNRGYQAALQ
jgi:hypothetical protein